MSNAILAPEDEKNLAEAELFRQQSAYWATEVALKSEEARKVGAYADRAVIDAQHAKRQEKINMTGNHHHHEFWFNDGVDEVSVAECAAQLAVWHRLNKTCPITIKINSPGGHVFDGMYLFDDISAYSLREWDKRDIPKGKHKTTIVVRGMAASMAGILLQAADHRVVGPEAYILVHEVSTYAGGKLGEIKDEVKFLEKMSDRVADIFVRRSGKITKRQFKQRWDGKEWWLTSEEALAIGFVDEIG